MSLSFVPNSRRILEPVPSLKPVEMPGIWCQVQVVAYSQNLAWESPPQRLTLKTGHPSISTNIHRYFIKETKLLNLCSGSNPNILLVSLLGPLYVFSLEFRYLHVLWTGHRKTIISMITYTWQYVYVIQTRPVYSTYFMWIECNQFKLYCSYTQMKNSIVLCRW